MGMNGFQRIYRMRKIPKKQPPQTPNLLGQKGCEDPLAKASDKILSMLIEKKGCER